MPCFGPCAFILQLQLTTNTRLPSNLDIPPDLPINPTLYPSRNSAAVANAPNSLDILLPPAPLLTHSASPNNPFDSSLKTHEPLSTLPPVISIAFQGLLALFAHYWSKITTNHWVLDIIYQKYLTEFFTFPTPHPPLGNPRDPSQHNLL